GNTSRRAKCGWNVWPEWNVRSCAPRRAVPSNSPPELSRIGSGPLGRNQNLSGSGHFITARAFRGSLPGRIVCCFACTLAAGFGRFSAIVIHHLPIPIPFVVVGQGIERWQVTRVFPEDTLKPMGRLVV